MRPGIRRELEAGYANEIDMADSIHTAPGWRYLAPDLYTCVIPPHMAIDRATLRRIHEFDLGLIPMVRKQRYLPPNSSTPVVVAHFALGRHVKNPRNRRSGFRCEMPVRATHPRPNLLEAILEDRDLRMLQEGGPGGFQRFGPWLYHLLRRSFLANKTGAQWIREAQKKREESEAREKAARRAEMAYHQRGMGKLHKRAAELTRADWDKYFDRIQRARQVKPRVFLGGH